ncbi:hypothetical protein G9A89_016567 [Geosiphon pyriformis]|nr:hypothetical protein G9A89_016567 [Geosiphon pyriformis]
MELVGSSAGGSGSVSAGLGTRQSAKKKCINTVYSWNTSYKKPKKSAASNVVDSSAKLLSLEDIGSAGAKPVVFWDSEVGSVSGSVSCLSNVKNMANMVANETSYAESDENNGINKNMLRKTRTQMYMLDNSPNANQMPQIRSRALKKRNFKPVKSFALDIEVLAVPEKTNVDKLMAVKKIFYQVDEFGGALTLSKFPGIIRLSFTSEKSLIKTRELAISEKILVNDDLRKVNRHSDWKVIVKEIPVDLLKSAVDSAFSKFGKIVSIKMQLIGLWQKALVEFESFKVASLVVSKWSVLMGKDSVHVALAVSNKQTWVSRDQHRALLYTLPVGTTAHDLSSLLELYDEKTCFIGCNPNSYVCDRCAIICFGDEVSKLAAIGIIPVFKDVGLHWAGLSLASCTYCKQFSHVTVNCFLGENSGVCGKKVVSDQDRIHLAGIYKKKSAPIAHPVLFGGKTWTQVAGGSPFCVVPPGLAGAGLHSGLVTLSIMTDSPTISHLNNWLAILQCSLELLTDCVSGILILTSDVDSGMIVDTALVSFGTSPPAIPNAVVELSSSSSKVFTAKVGGLETKLIALEASVGSILDKLNILCSGLGLSVPLGMNNCAKQADIICWHKNMNNLVSIVTKTKLRGMVHPWIANKFNGVCVFTSGLDFGHMGSGVAIIMDSSLAKYVCKISEVSGRLLSIRLLFGNKLSVSILGLYASASSVVQFFQASDINSLIAKAVNETSFVILGGNFNKARSHKCASFKKCFDLGLVNSLSRSAFVRSLTWCNSCGVAKTIDYMLVSSSLVNTIMDYGVMGVEDFFDTDHRAVSVSVSLGGLLDVQLLSLRKQTNKDRWKFNVKNASDGKWLEFKNATAVNASMLLDAFVVATKFLDKNNRLNSVGTLPVKSLFLLGSGFDAIRSELAKAKKVYCSSKMIEFKRAEESCIRQAIERRMESFEVDKRCIIRSVLEHSFYKVVLNHLVVDKKLVLELELVKFKVDEIMEGWTRKRAVMPDISDDWVRQFQPLNYVFDNVFSEVMCLIGFNELLTVISNLLDGKAAGLSGISNELINNISINNDKTVAIPINSQIANPSLTISDLPISIAKKGEPHRYLSIFLSSEGLSMPSLAKAYSDIQFFVNLVLRKAILDKQFTYLASAVLLPIISYRTQFSFILIQAESKSAAVLAFVNSVAHVNVSLSNNFLSGVVCIFSGCNLSLGTSLASAFRLWGGTPMSIVLDEPRFLKCVLSLKHYGIAFVEQLHNRHDGSLSGLSTVGMKAGTAVFFENIDSELGVKMSGLVSSMLMELQAIALTLKCVPTFWSMDLFSDSQAALDACKSKSLLAWPDFRNHCWIKRHHIANVIHDKNLDVNWVKVKGHSDVPSNECADSLAGIAVSSFWWLSHRVDKWFLKAGDSAISGNLRYFVRDIFWLVHQVHWEIGSSSRVLVNSLRGDVNWARSVSVWHPDSYMAVGFTSLHSAGFRTYFIKALHHRLPVIMCKHLYDRLYPSVVCLFCGEVEFSDHVFFCSFDAIGCKHLMNTYVAVWEVRSGLSRSSSCISQLLSTCASNCVIGVALCKGFIFNNWYCESVSVFGNPRVVACNMVSFVCEFCAAFRNEIWLVHVKHQTVMEKGRLILRDDSISTSVFGFSMGFSAGLCLFFSGACEEVSVHIGA